MDSDCIALHAHPPPAPRLGPLGPSFGPACFCACLPVFLPWRGCTLVSLCTPISPFVPSARYLRPAPCSVQCSIGRMNVCMRCKGTPCSLAHHCTSYKGVTGTEVAYCTGDWQRPHSTPTSFVATFPRRSGSPDPHPRPRLDLPVCVRKPAESPRCPRLASFSALSPAGVSHSTHQSTSLRSPRLAWEAHRLSGWQCT